MPTSDRQRRQDAAYTATGAAAGTAAMPARSPSNRAAAAYFQNLGEGTHQVPRGIVQGTTTATGPRLQNKRYTASLARHIGREESKGRSVKPSRFAVYDDGVVQVDGAHRIWARSMKGDKNIPINVTRVEGGRPANKPFALMAYKHGKAKLHRSRVRRTSDMSEKKLTRLERGMNPRAQRVNMRASASSEKHLAPPRPTKTPVLRAKQAAFIGTGGLAGYGASKLKGPREHKVKKNNPFGVELHEVSKAKKRKIKASERTQGENTARGAAGGAAMGLGSVGAYGATKGAQIGHRISTDYGFKGIRRVGHSAVGAGVAGTRIMATPRGLVGATAGGGAGALYGANRRHRDSTVAKSAFGVDH